jgi:molybdate transport system substrate-binding protein
MANEIILMRTTRVEFVGRQIPLGLLVKQMQAGGTITVGNMTWTARPDAYFAGLRKVNGLIDQGLLTGPAVPYVTKTLTIMVPKGKPGAHQGSEGPGQAERPAGDAEPLCSAISRHGGRAVNRGERLDPYGIMPQC